MASLYSLEIPGGVNFTPIELSVSGTLVTGVAGKRIVVLDLWVVASAQCNIKFQTSTGNIDLTGPAYCVANGGIVLPFSAGGWFQTAVGDSLLINLSPSVAVGGSLAYSLV